MDCQAGVVTGGDEVFLLCDKVQKGTNTNYKSTAFMTEYLTWSTHSEKDQPSPCTESFCVFIFV